VKTSELVRILKKSGSYIIRHGHKHDTWLNPANGMSDKVDRHWAQEVATGTAQKILKNLGLKQ